MYIQEYIGLRRPEIAARLHALGSDYAKFLSRASRSAEEVVDRIVAFSSSGKMIRGALVYLGHDLFSGTPNPALADAAAAMELFQSGLLIHDDIMDRDETRRGMPTSHMVYAHHARQKGSTDPQRAGEALGICLGDISFFLGSEALSQAITCHSDNYTASTQLARYCSRELALVGLAQMTDVEWGFTPACPSQNDVIEMYLYKTARYTFSMPLASGALLAGNTESVHMLERIGEKIGVVFQIRDDELGLFGSEDRIGKPLGSDIREGKKTLHLVSLMEHASPADRTRLSALFGQPAISMNDLIFVRDLVKELGIQTEIESMAATLTMEAHELIKELVAGSPGIRPEAVEYLNQLVEYVTRRLY